jgi:ADP-heptose:LPS heptosyltransferase
VKKILVISLAGIGDTLFATPLIHELRANFPDAAIDVLVKEAGARDLLESNPYISRVFYKNLMKCGRLEALRYFWSLRPERYNLSINTHPQSRIHYRIAAFLIGAQKRVSHEYECFHWLDRRLVNVTLPQDYTRHAAENNLALLPLVGAQKKLPAHAFEIYLTAAEQKWADDFLAQSNLAGKKWLGIHVGSGGTKNLALRRWPLENYIELARLLRQSHPELGILFFGGPEEKDDHAKIHSQLPEVIFPPTKNLRQAAALISRCAAFLSVDTALMNIAAAMRAHGQIVIETPTWNRPIEPFQNPFTLVKNPLVNGRGLDFYRYDGGDIKGTREELQRCMAAVTVEEVHATIGQALAKSH